MFAFLEELLIPSPMASKELQDVFTNTGRCQPWNLKRSTFGSVFGIPFNIET